MPKPRKSIVSLEATFFYHCVGRCVRRAFLCGKDAQTGKDFEHRRGWIRDRLLTLAEIFAIDVCAYAVMSNHYHAVLRVNREQALAWSAEEVVRRWHRLYGNHQLKQRLEAGDPLSPAELEALAPEIPKWRARLFDISWFMRGLNEYIARAANAEESCTGRFWEGRFKSHAVLDYRALLSGMVYVDLNPIRAGLAETPELSDFTSVQDRIAAARHSSSPGEPGQQPARLLPFVGTHDDDEPLDGLPFRLHDYLELVDFTGRILRDDKRGAIPADLPPILQRLSFTPEQWFYLARNFESPFKGLIGAVDHLRKACRLLRYDRAPGLSACEKYLS